MLKLDRLAHFAAVIETGSFTRAAERMGVTKAVVSSHVARLEEELGAALLIRTTRRVRPTEAGLRLHDHCQIILAEAETAESEIRQSLSEPRGTLRVTAPNDYGQTVLIPLAAEYRRLYPACQVELELDDQLRDIQSGRWDLAIRLGWPTDSALKSRRIGGFRQILVAAPALADLARSLSSPADLINHPFVANTALREPASWRFRRGEDEVAVRVDPIASVNTTPALLAAALAGLGLAILPDFLAEAALADGRLRRLLPDWELRSGGVFIVFPPVRFRMPKVTAFADLLVQAART